MGSFYSTYAYPYAPLIRFQTDVWRQFKDHEGKLQYYFYKGENSHGGICFRIPNSNVVAQGELMVSNLREYKGERRWYVLCRKSKGWRPDSDDDVKTSEHCWHIGSVLQILHVFAKKFGDYNVCCNDCNTWKKKVVEYMRNEGPKGDVKRASRLEDLHHLAEKMGFSLEVFNAVGEK